ncbi:MAG: glutathione S-transferase N-terminal domain-containing protein [Acidobacteriota bacterium]
MSQPKLFTLPGSHPGYSVALMLDFKGIDYRRVDLLPVIHKGVLRAVGFGGRTVPALKIGGEKLQGSILIARGLDRLLPDPPLLPGDPGLREAVLGAETFGHDELQHPIRQIIWWLLKRNRDAMMGYLEGSKIGLPAGLAVKTSKPLVELEVRFNNADDENVQTVLAILPDLLDRADAYVREGVLGGKSPNAADFQILPAIRLALTMEDLRPFIEDRPIGEAALRLLPDFPGTLPPGLPDNWLAPLRSGSPETA